MTKYIKLLFFISMITGFVSCENANQENKLMITVSVLPQKYFVEQIAGDLLEVNVMIPPGASPATYEPTPKQIQDLTKSALYLRIGYIEFEKGWMDRFEAVNTNMTVVNTAADVDLIAADRHVHGDHVHLAGIDPHVWTSPKTVLTLIESTYTELQKLLPENQEVIKKNYLVLKKNIEQLDQQIELQFKELNGKSFFIYHPALGYLARDYGFKQIAIEFEGKEPSPAHMKKLVDQAKAENIRVIFIQSQFNSENARAIANEIGASIISLDPLSEDWYNNTLKMTEEMARAMKL
ncbi:MAG: zinc ABC transporter substrate-binding protein [Bacteroidales bacterium]|nr:zinc ABC transporter substrate-binding protein [Bacteroidales bacterium]